MAELGAHTAASHEEVGAYAKERGVERLFAFGAPTRDSVRCFGTGGQWFESVETLVTALAPELTPGACVLVKGSRVNRLERVVDALTGGASRAAFGGTH
jgi:UDP-N-acetylmuramoyl-tripeptide--D-alanyl-D-alanine ligase